MYDGAKIIESIHNLNKLAILVKNLRLKKGCLHLEKTTIKF